MAQDILPELKELIRVFRESKLKVIYTQHSHEDPTIDGGVLGEWWGDLIIKGTPYAEILHEIEPIEGEKIIAKNRYNAFYKTDLDEYLQKNKIRDIIISGIMTNLCCETTARDAFVRDYRVFFLSDGTATSSTVFQDATLRNMAFGFADILSCSSVIKLVKKDL